MCIRCYNSPIEGDSKENSVSYQDQKCADEMQLFQTLGYVRWHRMKTLYTAYNLSESSTIKKKTRESMLLTSQVYSATICLKRSGLLFFIFIWLHSALSNSTLLA